MKRLGVWILALSTVATSAIACGDKYVVFGQGVRFQRAYAAAHPATILVYLNPESKWSSPDNRERLLTALRMVGHRPDAVTTTDEMRTAMSTNKYDIVLTEFATIAQAADATSAASVHPTIIPMVFEPTRAEMARIEKENNCAVQVSKRSHELLTVINTVMDQRAKGVTEACQRKHA